MRNDRYKLAYVLMCDDVRQEINGKEILIGVYNDVMLLNSFPAIFAKLIFRVVIRKTKEKSTLNTFTMRLTSPDSKTLVDYSSSVEQVKQSETLVIFNIALQGVAIAAPGRYTLFFGIDEKPREVWSFEARTHPNPGQAAFSKAH
jgi:hypothetical protein